MPKKFFAAAILFSLIIGALFLVGCTSDGGAPAAILMPDRNANSVVVQGVTLQRVHELPAVWADIPQEVEPDTFAQDVTTTNLLQLSPLYQGELLAMMHTSEGDIVLRFFPTEAPMAVENFLVHAWDGFYDGIIFHRVIPNFMVQTGCPLGNGTGGESIWGGTFGQELSTELRHFRGALAMAQTREPNSIRSQFYVVQNNDLNAGDRHTFTQHLGRQDERLETFPDGTTVYFRDVFPAEAMNYFIENGGTPHLDWHFSDNPHTVFGHVVWGMDVIDAIATTQVRGGPQGAPDRDRPVDDIIIEGFTFFTVQGGV